MWWTDPFWLLGLVFIGPLLWLGGFNLGLLKLTATSILPEKSPSGNHTILKRLSMLRVAAVVATVLALAGTSVLMPTQNRQMAIIFDTSDSVGQIQIEKSRRAALQVIHKLAPTDRVAVVSFAKEPTVLIPLTAAIDAAAVLESVSLRAVHPEQSNLQAALRVGAGLLSESYGNRSILLFSDGRSTSGGFVDIALSNNNAKKIPVYIVPVGQPWNGLMAKGLELPEIVHPGEKILAWWKVTSNRSQDVLVSVKNDGQSFTQGKITIRPGQTRIPLILPSTGTGIHRIEVEAATVAGQPITQAAWGGLIQVSGPSRILIINGSGSSSSTLSNALKIQGMQVTEEAIADIPDSAGWLSSYGAVILDNVPAFYLTENQQSLLQSYVSGGGGLLVIGGDSSLGRGDYYATGLEDLLPVQTDTRQRLMLSRSNILFVIDHSASMSELVGKTSKQLAAMQGVAAAVKELNPQDEVGILTFDTQPNWVIHFTPVSRRKEIMKALSEMTAGGGTEIEAAVEEIVRTFSNPGPVRRHVVILTDGLSPVANMRKLITKLKGLGVTVTTIGIGEEINEQLLRDMARWGGGRFFRAELAKVPQVIQKETVRITRDLIQEGLFRPAVKVNAAFLGDLEQGLPPVKGYLLTKPKSLATVYLQVGKNDPLLAMWRYGNGRVAVFTSDSGRRWLAPWSGSRSYNLLWSQLVRFIERASPDQGLRVSTRVEAAAAQIIVEAMGTDHRLKSGLQLIGYPGNDPAESFNFKEIAPGRYQANVILSQPGITQYEIRERHGPVWTTGWVWNPPGLELSELGPDLTSLGQLSNLTGGKLLPMNKVEAPSRRLAWEPVNLQNWLIAAALFLLLVELAYRSMALGQMAMARAVFESWWSAQLRIIETVPGIKSAETIIMEQHRTVESYRYLAESARKHKGGPEDA